MAADNSQQAIFVLIYGKGKEKNIPIS